MGDWNPKSASDRQKVTAIHPDIVAEWNKTYPAAGIPVSEQKQELTLRELSRQQAFDAYLSAQIGMNFHPGTTRDATKPRTLGEMVAFATDALAARDALFND